jgi:hypothetical protein
MPDDGYVHYDYTTGEEMISGSHLEQHAIWVEPPRTWLDAVVDRLGPRILMWSSLASVLAWIIVAACAWYGVNAAGWLEVPQ